MIAVGGNALSPAGESATITNQFRHTRESLEPIVEFVCKGWNVAVVHGNGPQVGDALLRNESARDQVSELPLGVLVASTAGWIGYMMQQSLQNALERAGADRRVVTVITQVLVDTKDPEGRKPRKFIGREVSPEIAEALREEGIRVDSDDTGRLRRRVASPKPLRIVEAPMICELVEQGHVVIAVGGGGTPVYRDARGFEGLDVVIDKDLAAYILAREIRASLLLILTNVDGVYTGYGTPRARRLERLRVAEARELLTGDELGIGSMRPKVTAAVRFVEEGGERSIIAALEDAPQAIQGTAGTWIVP